MLKQRVEPMLARTVPREWTLAFVHFVKEDIQLASAQEEQQSKLQYSFTPTEFVKVIGDLVKLEKLLYSYDIVTFYQQHQLATK
jgi:hypothetical protein